MKKLFWVIMVVSLVALLAVPAMADRDRHHDRDQLNLAWADDFTLQVNPFGLFVGFFTRNSDSIERSFNGFTGIAQVNQAAGSGNNQGNSVTAAITQFPKGREEAVGISVTDLDVIQANFLNLVVTIGGRYEDEIERSFNGFTGIAQVNQAAGYGNNQKNTVGVAANVNTEGALAIADTDLVQVNALNAVINGPHVTISAEIERSFNGGTGVAQVNQSPGSLNNQSNSVAVSYAGFGTHH